MDCTIKILVCLHLFNAFGKLVNIIMFAILNFHQKTQMSTLLDHKYVKKRNSYHLFKIHRKHIDLDFLSNLMYLYLLCSNSIRILSSMVRTQQ